MDYVSFGRTGIRVSAFCMGTMTFGKEADENTSRAIMDRAWDAGINFFDTANVYNKGLTEEIVGRWAKPRRAQLVIASKVRFPVGEDPNDWGTSRRHILMSVEQSLKRLQTDWLDVLYLHRWDEATPLEESLAALNTLVEQGKVHYAAVSNFSAWQTMKAVAEARHRHQAPITGIQPMYNLLKRQAEVEIFPLAQAEGLAVCPYNPLAAGILTGKYLREEKGRLNESDMYARRYGAHAEDGVAARFVAHARERGVSPAALAVAWVAAHPAVTAPILGARSLEQLNDTLGCVDIALTPGERTDISRLSAAPPLATDREDERE
jgi:aryl-alcohol dehydrogenase-like predicted oxidoreductase